MLLQINARDSYGYSYSYGYSECVEKYKAEGIVKKYYSSIHDNVFF